MKYKNILLATLFISSSLLLSSCSFIDKINDSLKGEKGEKGEVGDKGNDGINGKDGENGKDGINGKKGTSYLFGNNIPNDEEGVDGDTYKNLSTSDLYIKENGKWKLIYNDKGDKGKDGISGNSGTSGKDGIDGETYYSSTILYSENGIILPSKGSAKIGEEISFTFIPDSSYKLDTVSIINNGNEVKDSATISTSSDSTIYTLNMLEFGFVVSATFITQ